MLLLTTTLTIALKIQPASASGTVYIRVDGSIDPPEAPISTIDNVTYTLTGNITTDADGIVVERDSIVVDGAGFAVEGSGYGISHGIYLVGRSNVTIHNTNIKNFFICVWLDTSSESVIDGNTITDNSFGIGLDYSSNNSIDWNNIAGSVRDGIQLWDYSNYNSIGGNTIADNGVGIRLRDSSNNTVCHNNFLNNTVQAYSTNSTNVWDNGCEGNFWSNYNGTDLDNDGVGDTFLPWEEVDNCPLMNVYWNPSDISHDLKVDMRDIGVSAKAFGTVPGDTLWNPHADITGSELLVADGKVDMRDISLVARHFGEHYP